MKTKYTISFREDTDIEEVEHLLDEAIAASEAILGRSRLEAGLRIRFNPEDSSIGLILRDQSGKAFLRCLASILNHNLNEGSFEIKATEPEPRLHLVLSILEPA